MFAAALMTELEGVEAASVSMRPAAGDVARARFEDGAARQAAASSGVVETWRLRGLIKDGRLEAYRTWADAQGAGWFDFLAQSLPGVGNPQDFQGRFVGGAGRVGYQQVAPGAGAARWAAEMEIEMQPRATRKSDLIFWPHYAQIKSDLALGSTLQAERTGLQGAGLARQAAREDAPWRTQRLTAMVDGDRLFEFLHWLKNNQMGWIWLPSADGGAWRARIAGGYGGVALRQAGTRAGLARWEATLTLETPAPVEVKANVGRSIFDPKVALGDASRVYWRYRLPFFLQAVGQSGSNRIITGWPPGVQLEGGSLPGKFIVGGGAAHLSTLEFRTSNFFRIRLIAPGEASGDVTGPHLTPAARRGLAFVAAWGGAVAKIVVGDTDPSEPYSGNLDHNQFPRLFSNNLIDAAFQRAPIDVAVVWNAAGAGNTGFLSDFFTTRGGAAAP